jgi:hypothetical protein
LARQEDQPETTVNVKSRISRERRESRGSKRIINEEQKMEEKEKETHEDKNNKDK